MISASIIAQIAATILSVCGGVGNEIPSYHSTQDVALKQGMELRISRDLEKKFRIVWRDLDQKASFENIIKNSKSKSQTDLEHDLNGLFN